MAKHRVSEAFEALMTLDARIVRARRSLCRMSDANPKFERRVKLLIELVDERDRLLMPEWRHPAESGAQPAHA